jgi:ketohexokinase
MSKILGIGIATLDIINQVAHYPHEDEEMRAVAQRVARGGNASNTLEVLSGLGHDCHFCGTLAADSDSRMIEASLIKLGVTLDHCQRFTEGHAPTSYVTLNEQNGTRTIVHYRDIPELNANHFQQVELEQFDWFHFEGRNISESVRMLKHLEIRRLDQPISIEIEKERPDIDALYSFADVLVFSRVFVQGRGHQEPEEFMRRMRIHAPRALIVCPWGNRGAWAQDMDGNVFHAPAHTPGRIIDTLGAGDSFNAGLIHALASGTPPAEALEFANLLAGIKIGQIGFAGLSDKALEYQFSA